MNQDNSIFGLLVGAAIGAGMGILFAPGKGSDTRKRIMDEALVAKDKVANEAQYLRDKVANESKHLRDKMADTIATKKLTLDERLDHVVTDASYKADDLINTLEAKLKNLKAKNRKLHTN